MIKRQRWADVHRHLGRLFPEGESTTAQEVLERLRSPRRALRKIETWMTLHVELLFFFRQGRALVRGRVSAPFLLSAKKARQRMKTKENRWGRVHQELRQMFCRTPPHTAPAVLRRIHRYKTWELHRGSWDPLMVSRLLEQGRVHRELATLWTLFSDCHQSMNHKNVLDPSHPGDGRIRPVPVRDALVGLLPSTHPRDMYDTILLTHGGVEVSSLSSHVGQRIVGSHREREDRFRSMARSVSRRGRVCPT